MNNIDIVKKRSLFFQIDFFSLWLGQAISQLGDGLNRVALFWFVYKLTGKASDMAIIGILQTLPVLCVSLLAGPYLDRFNKKHAMIYIDLCRFALMMLIPILYHLEMLNFVVLCLLVLLISCFSVLFGPALTSTIPFIVSKERYKEANGLIQSTGQLGMIFGPALSGLLIPILSAPNILFIDAASFLISAICIIPLNYKHEKPDNTTKVELIKDVKEGLGFIFNNKNIFNTLLSIFVFNFFITSLPIIYSFLSKNILENGSKGMGFLMAGFGIGALLSSIINGYINLRVNEQRIIKVLLITVGFAFMFVSKYFFLRYAMLASIVIGICAATITINYVTLIQIETPKNMLSRTFTSFAMLIHLATVLGMFITGYLLDFKGVIFTLYLFGVITISATIILAVKYELTSNFNVLKEDCKILLTNLKVMGIRIIKYLNSKGYDIDILEDGEEAANQTDVVATIKEKLRLIVKSIKHLNTHTVRDNIYANWNILIQTLNNEFAKDKAGLALCISYIFFVMLIFVL
jgi:MFS family permease